MALGSLASSVAEQRKQKEAMEAEAQRIQEAQMESEERMRASEQAAGQPLRQAMAGAKTALSARDPFMEQAIEQGAYQQSAAELRKGELAAGGIGMGGRVRGGAAARAAAAAQGLMSRESTRIQRTRELNQLIGQQAGQLAEVTMSGMRTREQTIAGYQERASTIRQDLAQMPDAGATALRGATSWMAEKDMFSGGKDAVGGINKFISGALGYQSEATKTHSTGIGLPLWDLFGLGGTWDDDWGLKG